jgi:hypothetical protein
MKLVLVAYNEAIDEAVHEILSAHELEGFTKWTRVYGKGRSSGPHLGTHIWPKANNVLAVVTEDEQADNLMTAVRDLRARLSSEGIKAFMLNVEQQLE